jgi:hypothetical protein
MLDTRTLKPLMFAMTQSALAIGSEQTAPLTAYWLLKDVNLVSVGAKQFGNVAVPGVLLKYNKRP